LKQPRPKADIVGSKLLPRNLIPKPYIAGRKTLL
jgi:hypothetical protein